MSFPDELKPTHRLIKKWQFIGGFKGEVFGIGSLVHVVKRKKLPDVVCFLGRRAKKLGCCFYDDDVYNLKDHLEKIKSFKEGRMR